MILLAAAALERIEAAAVAAYPQECCGLLVGVAGEGGDIAISRAVASRNLAGEWEDGEWADGADADGGVALAELRRRRFEIDPLARLALMRELEGGDEAIVGHYHSHPDHPPEPSAFDAENIWEPDLIWLITAVGAERAGRTAAYGFDQRAGRFHQLDLRIGGGQKP